MARRKQPDSPLAPTESWSVLAVCEDAAIHTHALGVCDQFVKQYWAEVEFEFSWWLFADLGDCEKARAATLAAADADIIIFATRPEGDLPAMVQAWVESWLARRGEREGAIIDLVPDLAGSKGSPSHKHLYLREIAHRAKMDFLSEMPRTMPGTIPNDTAAVAKRASQITSVLDEILHQSRPPSHYGLNK
jgi:hypothetical protein